MRVGGYAAIRDYAAIGDGRTLALAALDGSIDWLCLPSMDSLSVFAGVRVTDALLLPSEGLTPVRELVRRVQGLAGSVPVGWRVEPRFGYGAARTRVEWRGGVPVATSGRDALAVCAWGAGEPSLDAISINGRVNVDEGKTAVLVVSVAHQEPLVFPSRREVEARLGTTLDFWRDWAAGRTYEGSWREVVVRSALALKLLRYSPSGAITAAGTTSLPEEAGGERNWDYRFCWIRDSAFTLENRLCGLAVRARLSPSSGGCCTPLS